MPSQPSLLVMRILLMSESLKSCWKGTKASDLLLSCCTTESCKDTLPASGDRKEAACRREKADQFITAPHCKQNASLTL